jgi:hypothetical protein
MLVVSRFIDPLAPTYDRRESVTALAMIANDRGHASAPFSHRVAYENSASNSKRNKTSEWS